LSAVFDKETSYRAIVVTFNQLNKRNDETTEIRETYSADSVWSSLTIVTLSLNIALRLDRIRVTGFLTAFVHNQRPSAIRYPLMICV